MAKRIAILGSTGSIGAQTLNVISKFPDEFKVEVLTANNNFQLLIEQAKKFKPNSVVIANEDFYKQVDDELWNYGIKTYAGEQALEQIVEMGEIDIVLTAMVGFKGLKPTVAAIKAGKPIALANKEPLVVAGEYLTQLAAEKRVPIFPVDSELSAIFQCLTGEFQNKIEKVYLTASGGPFFHWDIQNLSKAKPSEALNHPTYSMGDKISVDSATMMNKGFEAIEAKWLFQLQSNQIEIIVHPQSVVHSMVQFEDGSIKAEMGTPDMEKHILYALSYPDRLPLKGKKFSFLDYPKLTFEKADLEKFPNISLAYRAMEIGGNAACILNASNEVANLAFRQGKIKFSDISRLNEIISTEATQVNKPGLQDYVETDKETRILSGEKLKSFKK